MDQSTNLEMEIGQMGLENTYARCLLLYNKDLIFEIRNTENGAEVVIGEHTAQND